MAENWDLRGIGAGWKRKKRGKNRMGGSPSVSLLGARFCKGRITDLDCPTGISNSSRGTHSSTLVSCARLMYDES